MKEKFKRILEKVHPNSEITLIDYKSPIKDYRTHNVYIIKYKVFEKENKVVIKAPSTNPRKIINPIRNDIKNEANSLKEINENIKAPKLISFDESE